MNAVAIAQIANLGFSTLMHFLAQKQSSAKTPLKQEIKTYIMVSVQATETLGRLRVKNRKNFDSAINKMVDSVDSLLKNAEWKD